MANYFKLEVSFTSVAILDDELGFITQQPSDPIAPSKYIYSIASSYSAVNRFLIGSSAVDSALGYYNALLRDYGSLYTITYDNNDTVTIEGVTYDTSISNFYFNSNYITYIYTPPTPPDPEFEILNITAQAADTANRNTHARFNVSVQNGTAPYQINTPVSKSATLESDLYFDYFRQPAIYQDLNITDDNSDVAIFQMPTVDFFTFDSVNVVESFSGATVTAITTTQSGDISTTKEYSLNNIDWQLGSSFSGVLAGNYTMYVRDNYGALYSLPFTVVGVTVDKPEPYFDIVKANGLRFVPITSFDCDNVANWGNALLSELFEQNKYPNVERKCYNQPITDCDIIPTQINTNYDNISISVKDSNGVEILTPSATLEKENINQKEKRDCNIIQSVGGNVVVVFGGGNTYTPDTTTINGTYTNFSGSLPEFSKLGKLFSISGTTNLNGNYEQIGDYFDADNNVWGTELNVTYISGNDTGVCQVVYDKLDYNVWKFSLVGTAISNDIYQIFITVTDDDPRYNDIEWKSEPIKKTTTKNTVLLTYHHKSSSAGIDFTTGIKLKLRVPTRFIDGVVNEETDSFTSDYGKKTIQKTIITTSYNLETGLIPFYVVEKIAIASGMSNLLIDGVKYVKGEDSEAETLINNRNPFYKVNRDYQLDDTISIGEETGIVTTTRTVIGSDSVTAIGDENP